MKAQVVLLDEPDRKWVAIELSFACLDRGNDDKDRVQDPKDCKEKEAYQDQAKHRRNSVVDKH